MQPMVSSCDEYSKSLTYFWMQVRPSRKDSTEILIYRAKQNS